MAGKKDGPRPSWENLPLEKQIELREHADKWFNMRAEARKLAKLEGFLEANQKAAAEFFATKLEFIHAMVDTVRDEDGSISPQKVASMPAAERKVLLDAFTAVEKSAGFQNKVTTHKHEHKHSLADQFKQIQSGGAAQIESGEYIDVEADEDE